jgi:valyl-tRNA synthetase
LKGFDARYRVVDELKQRGLFVKQESHPMTIPLCEKSKDIIGPLIKPQWWIRMEGMADTALQAVEHTIPPESARKSYDRWLSNVNDGCLSRQLW